VNSTESPSPPRDRRRSSRPSRTLQRAHEEVCCRRAAPRTRLGPHPTPSTREASRRSSRPSPHRPPRGGRGCGRGSAVRSLESRPGEWRPTLRAASVDGRRRGRGTTSLQRRTMWTWRTKAPKSTRRRSVVSFEPNSASYSASWSYRSRKIRGVGDVRACRRITWPGRVRSPRHAGAGTTKLLAGEPLAAHSCPSPASWRRDPRGPGQPLPASPPAPR